MKKFFLAFLFCISALKALAAQPFDGAVIITTESYHYSDVNSINSFANAFKGKVHQGDYAYSYNLMSATVKWQQSSLSIEKRIEHYYAFTFDTAELYNIIENKRSFIASSHYDLALKAEHIDALAFKYSYDIEVSENLVLTPGLSYIQGDDFYHKELSGNATWESEDSYTIDAPARIYSATNTLLSKPQISSTGDGYSVDLSLAWQCSINCSANILIKDLYGDLNWQDSLETNVNSWQINTLNSDGRLNTRPNVEGRIGEYQQQLVEKFFFDLSYRLSQRWKINTSGFYTSYFNHHNFKLEYLMRDEYSFITGWHLNTQALELGFKLPYVDVRVFSDKFRIKEASSFGFQLSVNMPI